MARSPRPPRPPQVNLNCSEGEWSPVAREIRTLMEVRKWPAEIVAIRLERIISSVSDDLANLRLQRMARRRKR
jgi:hypothetical protein